MGNKLRTVEEINKIVSSMPSPIPDKTFRPANIADLLEKPMKVCCESAKDILGFGLHIRNTKRNTTLEVVFCPQCGERLKPAVKCDECRFYKTSGDDRIDYCLAPQNFVVLKSVLRRLRMPQTKNLNGLCDWFEKA